MVVEKGCVLPIVLGLLVLVFLSTYTGSELKRALGHVLFGAGRCVLWLGVRVVSLGVRLTYRGTSLRHEIPLPEGVEVKVLATPVWWSKGGRDDQ